MELPTDLIILIINILPLKSVKNIILTCKDFENIVNNLDWSTYCNIHNPVININFIINKIFMKNNGRYLLKIKNQKIFDSWLKMCPYIEILSNIINERDYTVVNNSELLSNFFESDNDSKLSLKISFGCDYSYVIYLSKNKYNIVEYWRNIFNTKYNYKDNILDFIKMKLLKEEFNYISFQLNDHIFFRECL